MKKRNKKYKPKRVDILSFDMAIRMVKPVEDDAKKRLSIDNRTAIEAFINGVADKIHFDTLASTVDVTLLMLKNLFNDPPELVEEVMEGWHGMVRARARFEKSQRIGFDGEALNALRRVCDIYEVAVSNVTGAELLGFYKARSIAIANGNYYKGEEKAVA